MNKTNLKTRVNEQNQLRQSKQRDANGLVGHKQRARVVFDKQTPRDAVVLRHMSKQRVIAVSNKQIPKDVVVL